MKTFMYHAILPLLPALLLAMGVALPACAGNATATAATHYRWKDAAGVVHYADTIPASALSRGYDIVNGDGRVIRHVARELTPAERRAAADAASQAAAARRAARQRSLEDTQLLAAYPTDKDLEASQQAQLKQIETDIGSLQSNLHSQEESLTDLLSHAADLEHADKPVPLAISKRITQQRGIVSGERDALAQRRADLVRAQARFSAQLQHYRALRTQYQDDDPAH